MDVTGVSISTSLTPVSTTTGLWCRPRRFGRQISSDERGLVLLERNVAHVVRRDAHLVDAVGHDDDIEITEAMTIMVERRPRGGCFL